VRVKGVFDAGAPREPELVSDAASLAELADTLRGEAIVALDTESNSFHVYRERICLLQISMRGRDVVVDPFAVDVRPLGPVLASRGELVLHGADYDVRCLKREFGWSLPNLFDTMAAARRLGRTQLGLAALVEAQFGVRLSKDFQRSDWGRRPLTAEQIRYAALDTRFLLQIHELLSRELKERSLVEEAREEFARIAAVEPRPKVFDREGWRKMRGARELDVTGKRVLRALWIAREERASALDRPPFKVLPEQAMLEIARRAPVSVEQLDGVPGLTATVLRRMGDGIAEALRAAADPERR
jgi:ribonuclease D